MAIRAEIRDHVEGQFFVLRAKNLKKEIQTTPQGVVPPRGQLTKYTPGGSCCHVTGGSSFLKYFAYVRKVYSDTELRAEPHRGGTRGTTWRRFRERRWILFRVQRGLRKILPVARVAGKQRVLVTNKENIRGLVQFWWLQELGKHTHRSGATQL